MSQYVITRWGKRGGGGEAPGDLIFHPRTSEGELITADPIEGGFFFVAREAKSGRSNPLFSNYSLRAKFRFKKMDRLGVLVVAEGLTQDFAGSAFSPPQLLYSFFLLLFPFFASPSSFSCPLPLSSPSTSPTGFTHTHTEKFPCSSSHQLWSPALSTERSRDAQSLRAFVRHPTVDGRGLPTVFFGKQPAA